MIKFKDVAHLYLGCEMLVELMPNRPSLHKLIGVQNDDDIAFQIVIGSAVITEITPEESKPILRPLSAMTEEEGMEMFITGMPKDILDTLSLFYDLGVVKTGSDVIRLYDKKQGFLIATPIKTVMSFCKPNCFDRGWGFRYNELLAYKWMLDKNFDLFDLIPNGEAIDKTNL